MTDFDVVIIGGGMIGLATACALRHTKMNIAIIDSNEHLYSKLEQEHIAVRASAINHSSQQYLQQIGIWNNLADSGRVQPFDTISVKEKSGFAELGASSQDYQYDNLGYIIENQAIQNALYESVIQYQNIQFFCNKVETLTFSSDRGFISLGNGQNISSRLIIAADGANSSIRRMQDIPLLHYPYKHHALVATVKTECPHHACARQLFYADGIVAFLPLWQPHLSCLVWSTKSHSAQNLLTADEVLFNQKLSDVTENWLGQCELVSERYVFPLTARYCPQTVYHRLILIGDAAHTIHPLAGQGANLGLQDSKQLTDVISNHFILGDDIGLKNLYRLYQVNRHKDTLAMLAAMEMIQDTFDGDSSIKKSIRGVGMNLINSVSFVKKRLVKHALGL